MDIKNIEKAINDATYYPEVKIKIGKVVEGKDLCFHVALIEKGVQAHVHRKGDEIYHILNGSGEMYVGKTTFEDNKPVSTKWESPRKVETGDVFNIPEGYAHSLKNTGVQPLTIAFVCPRDHLSHDRFIIGDSP